MVAITTTISTPSTLIEYSKSLSQDSMARTWVDNMVEESDVMRTIPFDAADRGKKAYMDIAALPTVGFRGLNEAGGQALGDYNLREEDTFFIDEYVFTDRALIDRLGEEGKYKQEKLKTISLAQMFTQKLIKGDNSSQPREPNGLQVRCNTLAINLLNNSVAANGAALSLGNLDQLYWLVNKPTHWLAPRGLMPFFDAAARNNTLVNQTVAFAKDDFGRRIISYKGLPILFGYEPDDSPDMLPFTEVGAGGGTATTSSIYCVSFRPGGLYAIQQTPLQVMAEGPMVGQPYDSIHVKWDWGIAREHPRAVARLTSIQAATIVG